MNYYVKYKLEAYYEAEVEAENVEEARKLADEKFFDADFGDAVNIEGEDIYVENQDGDYVWER